MNLKSALAGGIALALTPVAAQAGWVYDNLNPTTLEGDCSFGTTCAAQPGLDRGDEFAAQLFTLGSSTTLTLGAFSELDLGTTPTSVNWAIYDEVGGIPSGAALFSGTSSLTPTVVGTVGPYDATLVTFSLPGISLAAGSYDLAIQAVSPTIFTYLQQGLVASGAAESNDGGVTWAPGYENLGGGTQLGGISVAFGNTVPEASTWVMMLLGFAGLGFASYLQHGKRGVFLAS
jgi:hypothetical protein